jgi:class 3 adenylate cyclase/tetratricopeptide (TPR) repeat protein
VSGAPAEPQTPLVRVQLLGRFAISAGGREAGPWQRPPAKRLCELVLVSPGRRVSRDLACEMLFAGHTTADVARALIKALTLARSVLANLGGTSADLLRADRASIWVPAEVAVEVDSEIHEQRLRAGLALAPGQSRDEHLAAALTDVGMLLADEPYADWAIAPRERLESLRQLARMALARDRAKGAGRCGPEAVAEAWEACLASDPACEEAATALVRGYQSQGLRQLAARAYERCRASLDELGLRPSPALEEVRAAALPTTAEKGGVPTSPGEERRVVSVMFAEVVVSGAPRGDPEDLRELVGDALANVITAVEGLGGTVASLSGAGLQALFGAPEAHEDDPERAVRAAFRALSRGSTPGTGGLRAGVETGPAVVGLVQSGPSSYFRAVGAVVGVAAALQSVARPASVLVGPATRAATEGSFDWGATEEVLVGEGTKPVVGAYLEKPRPGAPARQPRLAGRGPLIGRSGEVSSLVGALQATEEGTGSVVVVEGEPGLGKTRLVQECRKRFLAWVGAGSGRLPLWAEGRCASYASTTPYGLYRHMLASWVGVAPDQPEAVVAPAIERALLAVMGDQELWPVLARMMDLPAGATLGSMRPQDLQRETFAAVRRLVARLARAGPTVLSLEDLHWADATSLRLTEELAQLVNEGPLLVLVTRRPHPDPGVSALEESLASELGAKLRHIDLAPLSAEAEAELAAILVGEGAGPGVVDAVRAGTEGNPLFLEERLFSMVDTGALTGGPGRWRLSEGVTADVPQVLERMVRSRVDNLSLGAQDLVRAASVIGTEPGLALLVATCDAGDQLQASVAEVADAGLLGELATAPEPTYRFRHALVQEAVYRGMLRPERRRRHGRVAWALESLSEGRLPEVAGVLGQHFAAAAEYERALHYFEVAGDYAAAAYANDEAIASFRSAAELCEPLAPGGPDADAYRVWAKLADVYSITGRRDEARPAIHRALAIADPADVLGRARLHTELATLESSDARFEGARAHLEEAKKLFPADPIDADQATFDQWFYTMERWSEYHRWRSEPGEVLEVLDQMRPAVELRGSVHQRAVLLRETAQAGAALAGYRVSEQHIADLVRAAEMVDATELDPIQLAKHHLYPAYFAFLRGDTALSKKHVEISLAVAERRGLAQVRAASMLIRPLTALRAHDPDAVREFGPAAVAACERIGYPEWVAMVKGTLAWLAFQEGRSEDVLLLAAECEELNKKAHGVERFVNWVRLWPVVAVHLAAGRVEPAVEAARQMLDPSQQRFEDELESLLTSACQAWDTGEASEAEEALSDALVVAEELRYL